MPSQRPLHQYPDYYGDLVVHVSTTEETFSILTDSVEKAKTLRVELYNYRAALREAVRDNSAEDKHRIYQKAAEQIVLRVTTDPPALQLGVHGGRNDIRQIYDALTSTEPNPENDQ